MKTIAIHLRLATASRRKRRMGIYRALGFTPRETNVYTFRFD